MGNAGGAEGTPIGMGDRLFNLFRYQGRGILGTIIIFMVPFLLMPFDDLKTKPSKTVMVVWFLIFSLLLIHPLKVPTVSFVPVFLFPVLHVMNTPTVCKQYFAQNMVLLVVGGYLRDLLNVSGVDKRFTTWMLFSDETSAISNSSLILKSSIAAYFLSIVSNRERVLVVLMQYVVRPLGRLKDTGASEPDFDKMKRIVANAVITSATIGSITMVNGAHNVMFMRILWETSGNGDTFNFIDYFCFALPTCIVMFIANLLYHMVLTSMAFKDQMSSGKMSSFRGDVLEARNLISDKMSWHEILAILFTLAINVAYFTRWGRMMKKVTGSFGWAANKLGMTKIPDASPAVFFLVLCALVPIACTPMKIFGASTIRQLPPVKPDASVMFWKIIDKGMNYGYMFLAGCFSAVDAGVRVTGVPHLYLHKACTLISNADLNVALCLVCMGSAALANVLTSVAASGMLTVLVLNCVPPTKIALLARKYLLVLMTGMATSFGFIPQFLNTPSGVGAAHLSMTEQFPYALGSVIICSLVLYVSICFYAPVIFEMKM